MSEFEEKFSELQADMLSICMEYGRDMPTEMKLIYDAKRGKFQAAYKYDLIYTYDDIKTAGHIADEWFEEVKSNHL